MSVRVGNPRIGHRVGGFYVSGQLTDPNAGRRFRVGHRLPGGFYGSVPVHLTGSRRPQRPVGSLPADAMVLTTVLYLGAAVALSLAGVWILAVPLLLATALCWLRWVANPGNGSAPTRR